LLFVLASPQLTEVCNNGQAALDSGQFLPFTLDGAALGYVSAEFLTQLEKYPDVFGTSRSPDGEAKELTLSPALQQADVTTRSEAVDTVMASLRDAGIISGWRNEMYPVLTSFYAQPSLLLERAAAPLFGIKAYGIHVNGYIVTEDGTKELWVARRAATKPTWPGRLDHIVAGGQPAGLTLLENVIKECQEEAGIPSELSSTAVPVGAVSYISLQSAGLKRDVLFCYDLELPRDFVPTPHDGEVAEFFRLPLDEVAKVVADHEKDPYKDNCNLVVLDFLVRHGILIPDCAGYLDVVRGLRSGDCS
jgi:8-oxo-dGTP pyrophosphatase MutT (NUDIX family)